MKPLKARIIGTGVYLPEKILSNQDLEKMVETSDEWIVTRTGMKERRIARGDESSSDMGYEAARCTIEKAGIDPLEIDLILCATCTPDHIFPSTACLIQSKLGARNAAAFDIQAACSGFLFVLATAKAFIEGGLYRNILIVAAEKLSSVVNYKDRNTCVLFGDGAAACLVSHQGKGLHIRNVCLGSDGQLAEKLIVPAGGTRLPASPETVSCDLHYLKMEGKEIFKQAVRRMEQATKESLDQAGISEEQISWFIPHQANLRIIEALAKRFQVPLERVFVTIHKYGNTSASSVGIALDEMLNTCPVKEGDNIVLTAFGAGLTWGASVLTHREDSE